VFQVVHNKTFQLSVSQLYSFVILVMCFLHQKINVSKNNLNWDLQKSFRKAQVLFVNMLALTFLPDKMVLQSAFQYKQILEYRLHSS